jgi:hypothetical protein
MKEFTVHEDLICPRSHFFRKAMSGPWKESEERKVDLPEDEPGVFALYLKLIYVSYPGQIGSFTDVSTCRPIPSP